MARNFDVPGSLVIAALFVLISGCRESDLGTVSGKITVDGATPAIGSSITFFPHDGKSVSAGDLIEDGQYFLQAPVGMAKVEIRVPRPVSRPKREGPSGGPGSGGPGDDGGGYIEESLPAKYHDKSELTFDVKPGKNVKDWDLSTK